MNVIRIAILGVAVVAAIVAAMIVRGSLGGGTSASQASLPPPVITADVLVAAKDITSGTALTAELVRWEPWPKNSVSSGYISKDAQPDISKAVIGVVVRAPLVSGQPITESSIVHAGAGGFMASTIKSGMRAIAIPISAETGAGGFVLPNDRVDVVLTRDTSQVSNVKEISSQIILSDIRVLAVDQTASDDKAQQSVVGKTVTLEVTPQQAQLVAKSHQLGIVSLALRALGDSAEIPLADDEPRGPRNPAPASAPVLSVESKPAPETVTVFRYGVLRDESAGGSSSASDGSASELATAAGGMNIRPPVSLGGRE